MVIGIPKETFAGERRVALVPAHVPLLSKAGCAVLVESGAGVPAGIPDDLYKDKGAEIVNDRGELFSRSSIVLQVRAGGANPQDSFDEAKLSDKHTLISFVDPLSDPQAAARLASTKATVLSMEMIPRITRAQSMDALSSMATVAGYKSVLLAANEVPRLFPMLMTAAGTLAPAKVFVIGVGVAGLQAIATAKRLGAIVSAYDVRPAVKEQVQSVGAKFVELELDAADSEDAGGYAKAQGEEFLAKQRELMGRVVAESDVVITTAAIPGKKAPVLVTTEMVDGMQPGSVIIDLAAERGGNCELTRADEVVDHNGVRILGPSNIPSSVPFHASQMYSKNITTLVLHMVKEGQLTVDLEDDVLKGTVIALGGAVVHDQIKELLEGPAAAQGGA